jgi:hypothetical protein
MASNGANAINVVAYEPYQNIFTSCNTISNLFNSLNAYSINIITFKSNYPLEITPTVSKASKSFILSVEIPALLNTN